MAVYYYIYLNDRSARRQIDCSSQTGKFECLRVYDFILGADTGFHVGGVIRDGGEIGLPQSPYTKDNTVILYYLCLIPMICGI